VSPLQTRQVSSHCLVMRLSWPKKVELRFLAGVAPLCIEQPLGNLKDRVEGRMSPKVLEAHVHTLANDARVACDGRPDEVGLSSRMDSSLKSALSRSSGNRSIAFDAGEADFERVALRRMALTWTVSRGGCGGAMTGLAVKSKGMPKTSAYSTLKSPLSGPSSFSS